MESCSSLQLFWLWPAGSGWRDVSEDRRDVGRLRLALWASPEGLRDEVQKDLDPRILSVPGMCPGHTGGDQQRGQRRGSGALGFQGPCGWSPSPASSTLALQGARRDEAPGLCTGSWRGAEGLGHGSKPSLPSVGGPWALGAGVAQAAEPPAQLGRAGTTGSSGGRSGQQPAGSGLQPDSTLLPLPPRRPLDLACLRKTP